MELYFFAFNRYGTFSNQHRDGCSFVPYDIFLPFLAVANDNALLSFPCIHSLADTTWNVNSSRRPFDSLQSSILVISQHLRSITIQRGKPQESPHVPIFTFRTRTQGMHRHASGYHGNQDGTHQVVDQFQVKNKIGLLGY